MAESSAVIDGDVGTADTAAGAPRPRRRVSTPRRFSRWRCSAASWRSSTPRSSTSRYRTSRTNSRVSLSSVSWVLNAYNIVFAAFLVGGGQLADLLGRRRVFSFALVCSRSPRRYARSRPRLDMLVAARVIQAAGAAMLVPSSLAIVLEAHDARRRMHAVALWSAVAALAAGIGPPLGGLLITASSWRLVFLVNIPVGLVAFVLGPTRARRESRTGAPAHARPARWGRARAGDRLARAGGRQGAGMGLGQRARDRRVRGRAVLGVYFVMRSSRQRTPVIDLSLLRIRAFSLSNGATIVMASGFYAYTLCNVLFLTIVWRYSILAAGLALTPGPFIAIAVAGPASRLVERVGHRAVRRAGRARVGRGHGCTSPRARRAARLPRRVAAGDGRSSASVRG